MSHLSHFDLQVGPVRFLLLLRHEHDLLQIGADGEAAELLVEVDLPVEVVVRQVNAPLHPAATEDMDCLDLVTLFVLGLTHFDPQVAPGGLYDDAKVLKDANDKLSCQIPAVHYRLWSEAWCE